MRKLDDLAGAVDQKILKFSNRVGYKIAETAELASTGRKRIGDKIRGIFAPPQPSAEPTSPEPAQTPEAVPEPTPPYTLRVRVEKTLIPKYDRVAAEGPGGADNIFNIQNGVVLVDGMGGQGGDVEAANICGQATAQYFDNEVKILQLNRGQDLTAEQFEKLSQILYQSFKVGAQALVDASSGSGRLSPDADVTMTIAVVIRFGGKRFVLSANRGDTMTWMYDPNAKSLTKISRDQGAIPDGTAEADIYENPTWLAIRNLAKGVRDIHKEMSPGTDIAKILNVVVQEIPEGAAILVTSDGFGDNAHPSDRQRWTNEAVQKNIPPEKLQYFLLEKVHAITEMERKKDPNAPPHAKPDDLSIATLQPEMIFDRGEILKHPDGRALYFTANQVGRGIYPKDARGLPMTRTQQIDEISEFFENSGRPDIPKYDSKTGKEITEDERWQMLMGRL